MDKKNNKKNQRKIFIISGPSGVGKTSAAKGVMKKLPFLKTSVTYSTRTKRLGKKEDKTIIHISEKDFREKINRGDFLEWALVHDNLYGTDKKTIQDRLKKNSILMNIDVQGAIQIKEKMPKETILIFLKTKNLKELQNRINYREKGKMPKAIIELRLKNAKKELTLAKKYDYIIINEKNQLKQTIKKVLDIIKNNI